MSLSIPLLHEKLDQLLRAEEETQRQLRSLKAGLKLILEKQGVEVLDD